MRQRSVLLGWLVVVAAGWTATLTRGAQDEENPNTCAWNDANCLANGTSSDKFAPVTVDFGNGKNDTFWAYVPSDVSTFYQQSPGTRKLRQPHFNGLFGKFINLSPQHVRILWDAGRNHEPTYIADLPAFEAAGTATYPGHKFLVTPKQDPRTILKTFTIQSSTSLYVYDPVTDPTSLSQQELDLYTLQKNNLFFAQEYRKVTGRDWLALYGKRNRPLHPMWDADFFGQTHTVSTRETHFVELPPSDELTRVVAPQERTRRLDTYRSSEELLNLTLTVLSCEPRVFEIPNFLSDVEVDHILLLAAGITLHQSSTSAGSLAESRTDSATRTSRNSWLARDTSPILDSVYKRAADVLQINEALLRYRDHDEIPEVSIKTGMAERLQLVLHYDVGQQYTPHHDFRIPSTDADGQPCRFATILLYLNDGMAGGETSFPRWMSAEFSSQLMVKPQRGKAVLFYSVLPDGNMDERSQHAALPVAVGEKWLTNLWVWDPYMRFH